MNKDNLEQFVQENRAGFDLEEPSPDLWNRIDENLDSKPGKRISWTRYLLRAASVILVAGVAWMANDYFDRPPTMISGQDDQPAMIENPEMRELLEAEAYYTAQVSNQIATLESMLEDQPEILEELRIEFEELDSAYAGLRQELNKNIAPEQIIEAMMQNHRIKASILSEILRQINHENNSHEATYNF